MAKAKKKQENKEAIEGKIRSVTDVIQEKKEDLSESAKKVLEDSGVKQKGEEAAQEIKKGAGKLLRKFSSKLKELAEDSDQEGGDK